MSFESFVNQHAYSAVKPEPSSSANFMQGFRNQDIENEKDMSSQHSAFDLKLWLETHDLLKYHDAFQECRLTTQGLCASITPTMHSSLGLRASRDRRKLRLAIAQLNLQTPEKSKMSTQERILEPVTRTLNPSTPISKSPSDTKISLPPEPRNGEVDLQNESRFLSEDNDIMRQSQYKDLGETDFWREPQTPQRNAPLCVIAQGGGIIPELCIDMTMREYVYEADNKHENIVETYQAAVDSAEKEMHGALQEAVRKFTTVSKEAFSRCKEELQSHEEKYALRYPKNALKSGVQMSRTNNSFRIVMRAFPAVDESPTATLIFDRTVSSQVQTRELSCEPCDIRPKTGEHLCESQRNGSVASLSPSNNAIVTPSILPADLEFNDDYTFDLSSKKENHQAHREFLEHSNSPSLNPLDPQILSSNLRCFEEFSLNQPLEGALPVETVSQKFVSSPPQRKWDEENHELIISNKGVHHSNSFDNSCTLASREQSEKRESELFTNDVEWEHEHMEAMENENMYDHANCTASCSRIADNIYNRDSCIRQVNKNKKGLSVYALWADQVLEKECERVGLKRGLREPMITRLQNLRERAYKRTRFDSRNTHSRSLPKDESVSQRNTKDRNSATGGDRSKEMRKFRPALSLLQQTANEVLRLCHQISDSIALSFCERILLMEAVDLHEVRTVLSSSSKHILAQRIASRGETEGSEMEREREVCLQILAQCTLKFAKEWMSFNGVRLKPNSNKHFSAFQKRKRHTPS